MMAPPKIATSPNLTPSVLRWSGILSAGIAIVVMVVLYFFNPSQYNFYPICQFHRLTGLNCPGCGATRSLYALLHGQFKLAIRDNALFIGGLFFAAIWWLRLQIRQWQGKPKIDWLPNWLLWTLLAVTLVFGVVRNLPGFEWLSPV